MSESLEKEIVSMKAVILAGGFGTRLSEETHLKPKPMVEIGGKPILWHILKIYSSYGINNFIICLGYKGYVIKEYFANYFLHNSDVTFHVSTNQMEVHRQKSDPWIVTLVDTGESSLTGTRLAKISHHLNSSPFCFTYGDGVSNVNILELIKNHRLSGRTATVTAVQPPGRYGALELKGNRVECFHEKPDGDHSWINGGFFVLNPEVIDMIPEENSSWEEDTLRLLASKGELNAYKHSGFWQPMDTLRDRHMLEKLWAKGDAPWKLWK